jgi:cell division protein FtsZ
MRVILRDIPQIDFICVNTDNMALSQVSGAQVLQIGMNATGGFGAGGDPDIGEKAAEESRGALEKALTGIDLVFVTVGMGGGTGTGAAPIVAQIAKDAGALVVGLVTTPFGFEGERRMEVSLAGAARLKEHCHNLVLIHNDRLLKLVNQEVPIEEAFIRADEAVTQGIVAVAEIVNEPAEINVDFADVRAILSIPGRALMAVGMGEGPSGPMEAVQQAIDNPLLDISIEQAQGVLFQVVGGPDMTLGQVNSIGRLIAKNVNSRAIIFFGMATHPDMVGQCRVTILATGIPEEVHSSSVEHRDNAVSRLLATPALTRSS